MDTILRKIDVDNIDISILQEASDILKKGEMVAFPTETVYGLGANALDEMASKKIYEAKGRPSDNPLIVHVANMKQLEPLVKDIPENAVKLMKAFWPGPLTIVFNKSEKVPYGTTGGLDTVAIRMPDNNLALKLIEVSDIPIAAPSANTSGRPSPTNASHVMEDLNGKISMILDGGETGIGIESTIVDVTSEVPMILRPGYINKNMLEEAVGEVTVDRAVSEPAVLDIKPKAPGMKYRHYAPKADFTIYDGELERVTVKINETAKDYIQKGFKVGIIASDETKAEYDFGEVISIGTRDDEITITRNLYKVLREFDDRQVDYILGEAFVGGQLGQAIMNRLLKAAGYKVESVT